jgi:hypothetical protein
MRQHSLLSEIAILVNKQQIEQGKRLLKRRTLEPELILNRVIRQAGVSPALSARQQKRADLYPVNPYAWERASNIVIEELI